MSVTAAMPSPSHPSQLTDYLHAGAQQTREKRTAQPKRQHGRLSSRKTRGLREGSLPDRATTEREAQRALPVSQRRRTLKMWTAQCQRHGQSRAAGHPEPAKKPQQECAMPVELPLGLNGDRRRFRPPAFLEYFLVISWRHSHSVCRHEVPNGGYWEDETNAPKEPLGIQKRSHVAH